jgi:lysophospholipase L1-like esterase
MSVQVSYKKQIIFFGILSILLFCIIEILFQIYDPTMDFCRFEDPNVDKETRVLICKEHNAVEFDHEILEIRGDQQMETLKINNFGFRGNDITLEKPEDVFRVIAVGGSTTFGSAVVNEKTYPYILQEKYNENKDLKIEVINTGFSGLWSYDEVRLINEKIIQFEPNLIIVYDGWNDVIAGNLEIEEETIQQEEVRTIFDYKDSLLNSFLRNFKTFTSINRVINYGDEIFGYYNRTITNYDLSHNDEKVNEWVSRWSKTCDNLDEKGIKIIIIIQPLAGTGEKEMTQYEQLWYTRYNNESINNNLEKYAEKLPLLDKHCFKTADFRTIYDHIENTVYLDNGHVNNLGNRILAENVYKLTWEEIQGYKDE